MTQILGPVKALEGELTENAVFPHLARLHQLPFAYAATVVEVVRRKGFAEWFSGWASRLEETLSGLAVDERKRRVEARTQTLGLLPWAIQGLEEGMAPSIKLSVDGGANGLANVNIGMIEIQGEFLFNQHHVY